MVKAFSRIGRPRSAYAVLATSAKNTAEKTTIAEQEAREGNMVATNATRVSAGLNSVMEIRSEFFVDWDDILMEIGIREPTMTWKLRLQSFSERIIQSCESQIMIPEQPPTKKSAVVSKVLMRLNLYNITMKQ